MTPHTNILAASTLVFFALAVCVSPAFAQNPFGGQVSVSGLPGGSDLVGSIGAIINLFLGLVGIIAGAFLILGGVRYISSLGNESEAEKAKHAIIFAVIGLIIVGLSAVIVNFVLRAF